MITCTLGDKKYTVPFISGRALREIGPASDTYIKLVNVTNAAVNGQAVEDINVAESLDVMANWFCNCLFQGQFTVDDLYDYYPADRLIGDLAKAILAVQSSTTAILSDFPTKPAAKKTSQKKDENR